MPAWRRNFNLQIEGPEQILSRVFVPCALEMDRDSRSSLKEGSQAAGPCSSAATLGGRRRDVVEASRDCFARLPYVPGGFVLQERPCI
jgi:hypothetical protein